MCADQSVGPQAQVGRWDGIDLLKIIELEQIRSDCFLNTTNQINPQRAIFGGQLVGLALRAASLTVANRTPHAIMGFFLRAGVTEHPLQLTVERSMDGAAFSVRRVVVQQLGKDVFHLQCSFQVGESGFQHAVAMPAVENPEKLRDLSAFATENAHRLDPQYVKRLSRAPCIEVRPVDPEYYVFGGAGSTRRQAWVRAPGAQALIDNGAHASLLAYLSDYLLASTAVLPHAPGAPNAGIFMASLNQAMWFYHAPRVDDWLLWDCDSPAAQNARGLGHCHVFDKQGRIVATAAQEVLIRKR